MSEMPARRSRAQVGNFTCCKPELRIGLILVDHILLGQLPRIHREAGQELVSLRQSRQRLLRASEIACLTQEPAPDSSLLWIVCRNVLPATSLSFIFALNNAGLFNMLMAM